MHEKKKVAIILIIINIAFIPPLIMPLFYLPSNKIILLPNPQYYSDELIKYITNNLWDSNADVFIRYQLANNTFNEEGTRTYASLNCWAYFAFVEATKFKNNSHYIQTYANPALEYVITNLLNHTIYGVHHWCFKNGSFPSPEQTDIYNDSTLIFTTYQSWITLALLDRYEFDNNQTYLEYANKTVNYLITELWDSTNYGFLYTLNPNDRVNESKKDTWFQSWAVKALIEAYRKTNNQTYLFYINRTVDFMLKYLWDGTYGGFFSYSEANGSHVDTDKIIFCQAGPVIALTAVADVLNNQSLISNYVEPTLNFTYCYLWDENAGQFYYERENITIQPLKIISPTASGSMMIAVLDYYEYSNNNTYNNMVTRP
ncbi:MAG: AGE family epimerase/isomerase, partial [Candidatus Helarchaeota archaeon]